MENCTDIPLCESLDEFAWDLEEVRDLIRTTPHLFGDDGPSLGNRTESLFGLESPYLAASIIGGDA